MKNFAGPAIENKYTRQKLEMYSFRREDKSFFDFDHPIITDFETPKSSIYTDRFGKQAVPVYSMEQHILDKISQYAPMIKEPAQIEEVKKELLESGVDFKIEHKDKMIELIEKF